MAHGFAPGSRFSAILNGRKRELTVVGIALSPEFVYAIGPNDPGHRSGRQEAARLAAASSAVTEAKI